MDEQDQKIVSIDTRLPKRRARRHPVRVLAYAVFFTVVVGGLIVFVTHRNELTADAVADLFSRLRYTFLGGEEPETDAFSYDDYMLSRFALFQNGLALLSSDRLVIYGPSGKERYGADCEFAQPALTVSDRTVLAYDRGGQSFLLADNGSTLMKRGWDSVLYTACMNRKGAFALVSGERGYASAATVFDDRQRFVYKWYSRDYYILNAALSPSAGWLALVSCGQEDDRFTGRVTLLETGREGEPAFTRDLPDILPIDVGFMSEDLFYVVTEEGVSFYHERGELLLDWSFGGRSLLAYDTGGEDFLALCLENGQSGVCELVLLDGKGPCARRSFAVRPDALSAAGGWVGVLTGGAACVYDADLEAKGHLAAPDVLALLMRADGSALLLGQNGATAYKP